MAEYKDVTAIKMEMQQICDNCWHPHRLGGCPEHCGINDAIKIIDSVPTVDAVPVRHGNWIEPGKHGIWIYGNGYLECDQCHEVVWLAKGMKFCPECGADMRKDGDSNG